MRSHPLDQVDEAARPPAPFHECRKLRLASGATLVQPADDTPYGRLAVLADPAGVQFNVMGPNKQDT